MNVQLATGTLALGRVALLGKGGEADVYDLGDGRALKLFKTASHPDVAHDPEAAAQAEARLDEHQHKLVQFPTGLPGSVVVPEELVRARRGKRILGYTMRKIEGAMLLARLSVPSVRQREVDSGQVARLFAQLSEIVGRLHDRGVVIGDFNDLNVLVRGAELALIDADSMQFGPFECRVFSERFVDPLLCDLTGGNVTRVKRPTPSSDLYALACLLLQSLLCVGPYGGVYLPAQGAAKRLARRITVFHPEVRYPRPARPLASLPEPLLDYLRRVFVDDLRAEPPAGMLDGLRFRTCDRCGAEHARSSCPSCVGAPLPSSSSLLARRLGPAAARALQGAAAPAWLDGDHVLRHGRFGPERVGTVIGRTARLFCGAHFAVGVYFASTLLVGFSFDVDRGGLRDDLALPPVRGTLVDVWATLSESHAFVFFLEHQSGLRRRRVVMLSRRGEVCATLEVADQDDHWLAGAQGACAVADQLLVPTDEGVVRVGLGAGGLDVLARFPETRELVDAAGALRATPQGLICMRHDGAWLLQTRRTS